jgi:hypothetical protein
LLGTNVGRRRIYENPAARTRAYRARRRLRLEARAFDALPLNLVRANPAAAAAVLVGELGLEVASRLRQELAQRGLAEQALAKQELTEQTAGLACCLEAARESGSAAAGNEPTAVHLAPERVRAPPAAMRQPALTVAGNGGLVRAGDPSTEHGDLLTADHLPAMDLPVVDLPATPTTVVVGLARVSGPGQEIELSRQEEQLEAFCAAQGWQHEIFSDSGSGLDDDDGSGPGSSKKGLKRLLELILHKRASRLVVTHKDRLAPGLDGSEIIVSLCGLQDIEVVETTETRGKQEA